MSVRNLMATQYYQNGLLITGQSKSFIRNYYHLQNKAIENWKEAQFRSSKMEIRSYCRPAGAPGSGVGKGGGGGGSVRESGGGLGRYGAAQEEGYFYNKDKEQLEKLKKKLKETAPGKLTQKEDK